MKRTILVCLVLMALMAGAVHAQNDITMSGISVTMINQNPDPANAGDIVELRYMVENLGNSEENNLEFELALAYPFSEVPGESYVRTITTLKAHQQGSDAVIIKYKVRVDSNAVKGENEIDLKQSYTGSDTFRTTAYMVDVTGTEYAQIIYVDKAKLDPGKETELTFTITNVGNSPLRNLIFSWDEESGSVLPVYSDDTKYVKSIDVGESVDLIYTVVADVNADSGLYQLDLSLRYETGQGTSQELSTKAGVFIGGETDFDVTFSESSEGQTSLSVANTGNNPALSVTVRVPEQEGYSVSGSISSIIGNLDKGDYTIVSFQISQSMGQRPSVSADFSQMSAEDRQSLREQMMSGNASTTGNDLKVQIEYTDTTGVRHTIEKQVSIQFRSSDTTSTTTTTTTVGFRQRTSANGWNNIVFYAALAALVIAFAVLYKKGIINRLIKRKKG